MFNGIVYNMGKIVQISKKKNSIFIGIKSNLKFSSKDIGSSVSCDGVCLTITKIKKKNNFFLYLKRDFKKI